MAPGLLLESHMEPTSRIERWAWLGFFLLAMVLITPPGAVAGLALWFWAHWKKGARIRWLAICGLAIAGLVGLALLLPSHADQIIHLRQALFAFSGVGKLIMSLLPLWVEGLLLAPAIAFLIELFHPATSFRTILVRQPRPPRAQVQASPLPRRALPFEEDFPPEAAEAEELTITPAAEDDAGEPPAQALA